MRRPRAACSATDLGLKNSRQAGLRLCNAVLQMPAIASNNKFASNANRLQNRIELEALIEDCFRNNTVAQVLTKLDAAEIANGAVNDVPAVMQHPQLAARKRWVKV